MVRETTTKIGGTLGIITIEVRGTRATEEATREEVSTTRETAGEEGE